VKRKPKFYFLGCELLHLYSLLLTFGYYHVVQLPSLSFYSYHLYLDYFFSLCSTRPQISIIFSTTIPPYPLTPVLVITNIVVSYELPVIARLLSFQFFSFTIWRCGGSGRYSPPYHVYRNMMLVETPPSSFPTKISKRDGSVNGP